MRNDLILVWPKTGKPSHFALREFETADGFVMVDSTVIDSLEEVRSDLWRSYKEDTAIIVTCAIRTEAENIKLAERLGWINDGGTVSPDSRHLPRWGGIAVDIKAHRTETDKPVPQKILGAYCRQHFDFVKDDYTDGHVHADNRKRGCK